jgi:hypothetical protein
VISPIGPHPHLDPHPGRKLSSSTALKTSPQKPISETGAAQNSKR